jgi:fructose transport system ATP-binding protein
MWLNGVPVSFKSPAEARRAGIETVYQDLGLVGEFDVAANFFLGRELKRGGLLAPFHFLDKRAMQRSAEAGVNSLKVGIPKLTNEVRKMSGGQRQGVAIARAAFWKSSVLLLDEPTAALGVRESAEVMRLIARLRDESGVSIIMISHRMEHVWSLADEIAVLRRGHLVAQVRKQDTTPVGIVGMITGANVAESGLIPQL